MKTRHAIGIGVLVAIAIVGICLASGVFVVPDKRDAAERIGDAIRELPKGGDQAADQIRDRTLGERIGDALRPQEE